MKQAYRGIDCSCHYKYPVEYMNKKHKGEIKLRRQKYIPSRDMLRALIEDVGMSPYKVSCMYNTTIKEVHRWQVKYFMLPPRTPSWGYMIIPPSKEDLNLMIDRGMSKKDIVQKIGIGYQYVNALFYLYKHDIKESVSMCLEDKLIYMRIYRNMSVYMIAEELGSSFEYIYKKLGEYGIEELRAVLRGIDAPVNTCRPIKGKYNYSKKEWYNPRYDIPGYQECRRNAFERDHYTCQMCGATDKVMHCHHILRCVDYPELVCELGNVITLCEECHRKVTGHEYEYAKQFLDITQPYRTI